MGRGGALVTQSFVALLGWFLADFALGRALGACRAALKIALLLRLAATAINISTVNHSIAPWSGTLGRLIAQYSGFTGPRGSGMRYTSDLAKMAG